MNKTRIFYPLLWAFFAGGVLLGTLGANLVSKEFLQNLGIHQIYSKQQLEQFSVTGSEWILYVLVKRMKFWLAYVLFTFTAARWVILAGGSAVFGCIGAILLVTITRSWEFIAIILFLGTFLPHYAAYIAACIFVMEAIRIWHITNRSVAMRKIMAGSLCWVVGMACEIFLNPTLLNFLVSLVQ